MLFVVLDTDSESLINDIEMFVDHVGVYLYSSYSSTCVYNPECTKIAWNMVSPTLRSRILPFHNAF